MQSACSPLLNAGQKFYRMLEGEHSAILLTFIKLSFVIKVFILSIFSGSFTQVLLYMETFIGLKRAKSKHGKYSKIRDLVP